MGTNYYWRHNICSDCGRYDELHICKSLISFQGHFAEAEWDNVAKLYAPPALIVASWAGWKDLIRDGGEVWDEYGHRQVPEDFIARVEATDPVSRRRQYDWCVGHPEDVPPRRIDRVGPRGEWLDADGFSFYGGDFS
jgi:hypothetical protein